MARDSRFCEGPVEELCAVLRAMAEELELNGEAESLCLKVSRGDGGNVVSFGVEWGDRQTVLKLPLGEVVSGGLLSAMGPFRATEGFGGPPGSPE